MRIRFARLRVTSAVWNELDIGSWSWRGPAGLPVYYAWLAIAILFFIYFYPVWTGIPIGSDQYLGQLGTGRMWFLKWI